MKLMNLASHVMVILSDPEGPRVTTVLTKNDCGGRSMQMPIYDYVQENWHILVEWQGFGSDLLFRSVFLPDGKKITLWTRDEEGGDDVRHEIVADRRDSDTGCTDITDENGEAIPFYAYFIEDIESVNNNVVDDIPTDIADLRGQP